MNPFLTVHGPRPAAWWATCDLCGKPSTARFATAEEAAEWEHDCDIEADDGTVVLTVTVPVDAAPKIDWEGQLTYERIKVVEQAFTGMAKWSRWKSSRERHPTWRDLIVAEWIARRQKRIDATIAEFEEAVARPFVCPGCSQRCKTVGGLKNHMRACYQVDPFKLQRGEYDDAMVPGGRPETTT